MTFALTFTTRRRDFGGRTEQANNDHDALAALVELSDSAAPGSPRMALREHAEVVDVFLRPDDHPIAKVLFASLRRVARKRAMTEVFCSPDPALEGRLRAL